MAHELDLKDIENILKLIGGANIPGSQAQTVFGLQLKLSAMAEALQEDMKKASPDEA